MSWTDERIDRLKELWTKGMTASQIAEELGAVSRNAVIGKAHRLGLQSRPSPVKANEPTPAAAPKVKKSAPPVDETPPFDIEDRPATAAQPAEQTHPAPAAEPAAPQAKPTPQPRIVSVGPGGFLRQGPGDQQQPIPPAPPRRLVPAKPSAEIADKTCLRDRNDRVGRWPMGHPGEPDFHF